MILYAVYSKGHFVKFFHSMYDARDFVACCSFVMRLNGFYEPADLEIKEEKV